MKMRAEEGEDQVGRPELELERDNEFYTVNGKAFEYMQEPIKIKLGEPVTSVFSEYDRIRPSE